LRLKKCLAENSLSFKNSRPGWHCRLALFFVLRLFLHHAGNRIASASI